MTYLLENERVIRTQREEYNSLSARVEALSKLVIPSVKSTAIAAHLNPPNQNHSIAFKDATVPIERSSVKSPGSRL